MSRAACSAMVASLACSEPTCLWARPLRLRMKTSHSGVFGVAITISLLGRLRGVTISTLLGISAGCFAHPRAVVMGLAARGHAVAVAGAVAGQHLLELGPVDLAVAPVPFGIPFHAGIWNGQPQELRLR